jgi:tungstate transport system substrate-binding protein
MKQRQRHFDFRWEETKISFLKITEPLMQFRKRLLTTTILFVTFLLAACQAAPTEKPNLILATTTSTQDSGLLDVLVPMFEEEHGYVVQTVAVGTGAALRMAEEGNADVLLVHAPPAEEELMRAGFGKDRFLIMHNDFVIVGPVDDPAGIANAATAAGAFSAIYSTGAPFVSRGDDSGTNKKELAVWHLSSFNPNEEKPGWYIESGQGMGSSLFIASEKNAYTLTDRGTYLAQQDNLTLDILVEEDAILLNIYHVITVNPEKWPGVNYEGALTWANFITGKPAQEIIRTFGVEQYGQPLFFPDAGKAEAVE